MRKFGVVIAAGLMVMALLATTAQASEQQDECQANGLARGIYPGSNLTPGGKGLFDLSFTPNTHGRPADMAGSAYFCGTAPEQGLFYTDTVLYLPDKGEQIRCANPINKGRYCRQQEQARGGPYDDLGEGWYMGKSRVNVYCDSVDCVRRDLHANADFYVDYDTTDSWPIGDRGPNRCTPTAIQCGEARFTFFGANCNADVVYEPASPTNPYRAKVQLRTYEMHCQDFNYDRQYLMAVEDMKACGYANKAPGGTQPPCSSPSPETATNLNGSPGTWIYSMEAMLTDGSKETATATITWT